MALAILQPYRDLEQEINNQVVPFLVRGDRFLVMTINTHQAEKLV